MSEDRRNALVAAGREAMVLYLDRPPAGLVLPSKAMPPGMEVRTTADRIAAGILGPGCGESSHE